MNTNVFEIYALTSGPFDIRVDTIYNGTASSFT